MSLEISWSTLIVGAGIYVIGIFVKPLILLVRDNVVWWLIKKYVYTDEIRNVVYTEHRFHRFTQARLELENAFTKVESPTTRYVLNRKYRDTINEGQEAISLTEADFKKLMDKNSEKLAIRQQRKLQIEKASNTFDSLIKHYSQDKTNLIELQINELADSRLSNQSVSMLSNAQLVNSLVTGFLNKYRNAESSES